MHGFAPSDMEMEDELAKLAIKRNQLLTDMRASKDKKKAAIIMRAGKANRGPMVAELLSEMHLQWRIQGKSTGRNDDSEANETALSNASNFKGKCYKCGKDGHRAAQCESTSSGGGGGGNNNNNGGGGRGRFNGKCNNCGKIGHKYVDCWQKKENSDKRPKYYKVEALMTEETLGVEFLLTPKYIEQLNENVEGLEQEIQCHSL